MALLTISNTQARRLILNLQGLGAPAHRRLPVSALLQTIEQLGFVQIDSIRWVERAQHMILFSRNEHYRPDQLKRLIETDGKLFENYTHDASIIPADYYMYWRHKFRRIKDRLKEQFSKWQGDGFLGHCDSVIQQIEARGPTRSRELKNLARNNSAEMWQWSDAKTALEYLWRIGTLAIASRSGFEKVYDLSGRTIPSDCFDSECSEAEFIDWSCRSALERLGIGSPAQIAGFWNLVSIAEVRQWLKTQSSEQVVPVEVQGSSGESSRKVYARGDIESVLLSCTRLANRLRVMSPFDPVMRDRDRLEWMFAFQYRIEIYVPAAKRQYGYYVFPLLDGERLVGRIDMRAHRDSGCLRVENIWWEDGVRKSKALTERLDRELARQAKFVGAGSIQRNR